MTKGITGSQGNIMLAQQITCNNSTVYMIHVGISQFTVSFQIDTMYIEKHVK